MSRLVHCCCTCQSKCRTRPNLYSLSRSTNSNSTLLRSNMLYCGCSTIGRTVPRRSAISDLTGSLDVGGEPLTGTPVESPALLNEVVHRANPFLRWRVWLLAMTEDHSRSSGAQLTNPSPPRCACGRDLGRSGLHFPKPLWPLKSLVVITKSSRLQTPSVMPFLMATPIFSSAWPLP